MQADQLAASARPVAEALIKGDAEVATVGNPAGKPIIEFFDYNCGFCKRFHSETATPLLRSEEHTSELQSLMRISYAVFCLKTQTKMTPATHTTQVHKHK